MSKNTAAAYILLLKLECHDPLTPYTEMYCCDVLESKTNLFLASLIPQFVFGLVFKSAPQNVCL
jgi:hypothetical protein